MELDIEREGKQKIREQLHNRLDEDALITLEDHGWDLVDGTFAYLARSVPLDLEQLDDSIHSTIQELHEFRRIVEPYIGETVTEHQNP